MLIPHKTYFIKQIPHRTQHSQQEPLLRTQRRRRRRRRQYNLSDQLRHSHLLFQHLVAHCLSD